MKFPFGKRGKKGKPKPFAAKRMNIAFAVLIASAAVISCVAFFLPEDDPPALPVFHATPQNTEVPSPPAAPAKHRIFDIPYINQVPSYPTACESVCAVMALRFAGISMDVDTFLQSYLPKAEFVFKNGEAIGYHPNECFMGDPYSSTAFGCWASCIEKAFRKFLPRDYSLINTSGTDLSDLCRRYIDNDIPVMIWATEDMAPPQEGVTWTLFDGGTFQWIKGEHCLLLTGYDDTYYYFHDPIAGVVPFERSLVQTRYEQLGSQSLALCRNKVKTRCMDFV